MSSMSRIIPFIAVSMVMVFGIAPQMALAAQLSVEKAVENSDISVGDNVNFLLKFSNPFGKPVNIQIQDKNVIAGNGLDIQCLEYTIPADGQSTIAYSQPITAFQAGDYTLAGATVTYENPDTKTQEQVQSNELGVSVKQSQAQQNPQQQGITTVYQCGGTSMTSTSYSSSGSSTSIQISSGFGQQSGQQPSQSQSPENVQQQNQDMSALKQQMENQMREQQQAREMLEQAIENSSSFQQAQNGLEEQGYEPDSKSIKPDNDSSGESGSFEYNYKKADGDEAKLSGKIEDGQVKELNRWSREDADRLARLLENSTEFRQLHEQLAGRGYNITAKAFSEPDSNISEFDYEYEKANASEKSIAGNITLTGDILSIELLGEEEDSWLPWLILLAIAAIISAMLYKKYHHDRNVSDEAKSPVAKKAFDFRKESLNMLNDAERMFSKGMMKDAYTSVSKGVRLYFKHTLNSGKEEFTSTDILKHLKRHGSDAYKDARQCFEICDLVKFAKYRPNEKDFGKAISIGRSLIK